MGTLILGRFMAAVGILCLSQIAFSGQGSGESNDGPQCKSPIELKLDASGDVTMKFCQIPATSGYQLKTEDDENLPEEGLSFVAFHLGQNEVSQLQYRSVLGEEPWIEGGETKEMVVASDNNPAVYVSYDDVVRFVEKIKQLNPEVAKNFDIRLPTSAEWEYALWGNSDEEPFGGKISTLNGHFNFTGETIQIGDDIGHGKDVFTCPHLPEDISPGPIVSPYAPTDVDPGHKGCLTSFGIAHMLGNVSELTADNIMKTSLVTDEILPSDGNLVVNHVGGHHDKFGGLWGRFAEGYKKNIERGGDWKSLPSGRSRGAVYRSRGKGEIGFRLAIISKD